MAHDWDIIGYAGDGELYCDDCGHDGDTPILEADHLMAGAHCADCHSLWLDGAWQLSSETWRWATCARCHGQRPFDAPSARQRLDARRGRLACEACGGPLQF